MATTIEIIGVYPIKAREPVHLVEMIVRNSEGVFDISTFTQELPSEPRDNWQVPYDERILNAEGTKAVADGFEATDMPELWIGDVRIAFFFHYLELSKQLVTPFGKITLPGETKIPSRLTSIKYEVP